MVKLAVPGTGGTLDDSNCGAVVDSLYRRVIAGLEGRGEIERERERDRERGRDPLSNDSFHNDSLFLDSLPNDSLSNALAVPLLPDPP